ncbi:RebB family R body protein [Oceanibacterium hippocampi]|uniref:Killing trait n=1 Tax=Oceanibacterium hippocampi TaxID=745714 RepID=A0A1Y5T7T3_9PROT|nr:RebB family R body protein [Oceanibacterium hippocampi]SLN57812.1 Killing trait [Oceanibacterium hippocampi]
MATESYVNSQITDAVSQTNVAVVGEAPAEAIGALYQQMSHALGLALQNVISQQQHMHSITNAVTIAASKSLLASDPAQAVRIVNDFFTGNRVPEDLAALQAVVEKMKS